MDGAFYRRSELSAAWGLSPPATPGDPRFHAVASGRAWLETDEAEPVLLRPGDFALVPHGEGHRLRSEPGAPVPGIF